MTNTIKLQMFKIKDFLAIIILFLIWFFIVQISNFDSILLFAIHAFATIFLAVFAVLLIKKIGTALLFYLLCASFTLNLNSSSPGLNKLITFLFAGLILELFAIKTFEYKNIPFNLVLGAGISAMIIPLFSILLGSLPSTEWNLVPASFLIGIIGGVLAFLFWYKIKRTKHIIKFEYRV